MNRFQFPALLLDARWIRAELYAHVVETVSVQVLAERAQNRLPDRFTASLWASFEVHAKRRGTGLLDLIAMDSRRVAHQSTEWQRQQ
jgi:hypothetical protein